MTRQVSWADATPWVHVPGSDWPAGGELPVGLLGLVGPRQAQGAILGVLMEGGGGEKRQRQTGVRAQPESGAHVTPTRLAMTPLFNE